jgi:hypothetical protein
MLKGCLLVECSDADSRWRDSKVFHVFFGELYQFLRYASNKLSLFKQQTCLLFPLLFCNFVHRWLKLWLFWFLELIFKQQARRWSSSWNFDTVVGFILLLLLCCFLASKSIGTDEQKHYCWSRLSFQFLSIILLYQILNRKRFFECKLSVLLFIYSLQDWL